MSSYIEKVKEFTKNIKNNKTYNLYMLVILITMVNAEYLIKTIL